MTFQHNNQKAIQYAKHSFGICLVKWAPNEVYLMGIKQRNDNIMIVMLVNIALHVSQRVDRQLDKYFPWQTELFCAKHQFIEV